MHIKPLEMALEHSRQFFREHGLGQWAKALPPSIQLSEESQAQFGEVEWFDSALVMPPLSAQMTHADSLITQLLNTPSDSLSASQQYTTEAWILNPAELTDAEIRNRPDTPYVLLYRSAPFPEVTLNQTSRAKLDRVFISHQWDSLTFHEYLVLQRTMAETRGDHSFDDYTTQQLWLLDSRFGDKIFHSHWNAKAGRVEIGWCKPSKRHGHRGAQPTRVIPIVG